MIGYGSISYVEVLILFTVTALILYFTLRSHVSTGALIVLVLVLSPLIAYTILWILAAVLLLLGVG